MSKNLLIVGLVLTGFILQGCNSAISQSDNNVAPLVTITPSPKAELPEQQKVEFKGVSFTYNPQIFGEVRSEEIAELPLDGEDYKPDSVAPQHILFKLRKQKQEREVEIYIFPIEDYRRMYPAVSKQQNYREQFEDQLKGLQKVIKDRSYRKEDQIPFIPFWDGSQTFQQKVKHFSFQSGKGIFFLTQFDIEPSLVNNEGLTYCFQGISNNEKYYILAKFPVSVSFLPKDSEAREFEDYKLSDTFYGNEANQNKHEEYISKIAKRLDNLEPNEFEPNLNQIEEIIASLKIEK